MQEESFCEVTVLYRGVATTEQFPSTATVKDLHDAIAERKGDFPVALQRLVCQGQRLDKLDRLLSSLPVDRRGRVTIMLIASTAAAVATAERGAEEEAAARRRRRERDVLNDFDDGYDDYDDYDYYHYHTGT